MAAETLERVCAVSRKRFLEMERTVITNHHLFFFFFGHTRMACGILVPRPRVEPARPALGA